MKLFLGKDLKEEEICWKCAHPQAIQDVDEFIFGIMNWFREV